MTKINLDTANVVGQYGVFGAPVILMNGEEYIAQMYFLDAHGNPLYPVCESQGCDYCGHDCPGCRYSRENKARATASFIG